MAYPWRPFWRLPASTAGTPRRPFIGRTRPIRFLRPLYGRKRFAPGDIASAAFHDRVETKTEGGVSVSVAVLSPKESRKLFDGYLAERGIQPVWIEIDNREDNLYYLIRTNLDPDYLSSFEVSRRLHTHYSARLDRQIDLHFRSVSLLGDSLPNTKISGIIFTNLDEDYKLVNIELLSRASIRQFFFIQDIPGMRLDHARTDFENLYSEDEIIVIDQDSLRAELEKQPANTVGGDRKTPGDPLNAFFIGQADDITAAYRRRGWDETELTYFASAWKTLRSLLFRSRYRHSPVSNLYAFGRRQDIALQKSRSTVAIRNHMRAWLTPLRYKGMEVYIVQISRDIGLRLSTKTMFTHKIDPDVDDARDYLILDLLASQGVSAVGFVKGVGAASMGQPRYNYTKDPYFTDGYRAVIFFTAKPTPLSDIELLEWEWPPNIDATTL